MRTSGHDLRDIQMSWFTDFKSIIETYFEKSDNAIPNSFFLRWIR